MPGLVQRGHKRPSLAISDDEDEYQSDHSSVVSAHSKRARHTRDASGSPVTINSNHVRSQARIDESDSAQKDDGFQPGSLIRIKLENFVTYTAAEFHLGPSLNMVIGPNGTGKSTLVCAICLGLGWGSEHLGRAKELGAFVKHGANQATIEIELAAGPGMDTNPIVRRIIRKEDNKSQFILNGKVVPQKSVTNMCKGLSIQIDNLCQFLPQDRVVEFAKMTDVDRLRETQRAAAPAYMVEWHDQLKALRSEERKVETQQRNEQGHLERLEQSQNSAREDVERWHQREDLLQKSRCLKKVKPIIEMRMRKEELRQARADLIAAKKELESITAEVEPVRQAQAEVQLYQDQIQRVVDIRKDRVNATRQKADQIMSQVNVDKQKISDSIDHIQGEANAKKGRDRDIVRLHKAILDLERQMNERSVDYDAEAYETRKAELRSQYSALSSRIMEKEDIHRGLASQGHELQRRLQIASRQRHELDTQVGKQVSLLARVSRDTARAWKWFQENRHSLSLKGEVYGPPILECSIPDTKYAQAVESQIRKGEAIAITCTHSEDQKFLSNKFVSKEMNGGLGLQDIYLRSSPKPLAAYAPKLSKEELANFGFEAYLLDFITGPDAVLAMLCENSQLHRVAFASRALSDDQYAAVEQSQIRSWVSGNEIYRITVRAEYGARSTQVSHMRKAQFFVEQPVNVEEKRQLDDAIKDIQREGAELKENLNISKEELRKLKDESAGIKQARDELQAEQDRMKKAVAEWNALPNKIARKQSELETVEQQNAETRDRIRTIKAKSQEASIHMANMTVEYTKAVIHLRTFHESLVEAEIRLIEAKSELNALIIENREILNKLNAKKAEVQQLDQRNRTMRSEYERVRAKIQEDVDALSDEEKAIMLEYRELPSLEALEQEVAAVAARLEMMSEGNPGAIKAYEKREEEIRRTRGKLGELTAEFETTRASITQIRQQWEPELDALISKISDAFSHNFQQIGCAGEVAVYKDEEDFDNWSVQISVRFREGEQLSILNANRQSGGERAVSTIFYLMALQDLAQSPFRVVDEINQGMDPRNERMVHERMVDIACQERTSQYFLITPKLLTGLKFHPKMKVHVINSGEHIPDIKTVEGGWDLKDMAQIALRTRKGIEIA